MNATKVQQCMTDIMWLLELTVYKIQAHSNILFYFFLNRVFKIYTVNLWYTIITIARKDYIANRQNKKTTVNLAVT